ncbi:MAG: YciI family protein [Alphaproteobacteria bacterium]
MEYLLLIYEDEAVRKSMSPDALAARYEAFDEFTNKVVATGRVVAARPLEMIDVATSVRVRAGQSVTTDGPFAETKEQLAGFYMLDCDNLDQALDWAAQIPAAQTGTIEVRPVANHGKDSR